MFLQPRKDKYYICPARGLPNSLYVQYLCKKTKCHECEQFICTEHWLQKVGITYVENI
jgi:hypothetical protein